MSSGFKSATMLRAYFGEILSHSPERSGLPSGARGAGAVRFGLPPGVRGMPGVGWFSHCAASGTPNATVSTATRDAFIPATPLEYCCRRRHDVRGHYVTNRGTMAASRNFVPLPVRHSRTIRRVHTSTARVVTLTGFVIVALAAIAFVRSARVDPAPGPRFAWVGDAHQLGPVGYRDPAAAISPDGRWLAYSEGRFLRVRPIDGGPIVDLPPNEAQIRTIAWAPDSRSIVADGYQSPPGLAEYDRIERTRRPLWADHDPLRAAAGAAGSPAATARVADLRQPAWSPDGRSIAAIVNARDGQELWTIAADGASAVAARMSARISSP